MSAHLSLETVTGLAVRDYGPVSVVDLPGQVVLGDGDDDLYETVRHLVDVGRTSLVLNMKRTSHFDSMGLGTLVACRNHSVSRGASIAVAEPDEKVLSLLSLTSLHLLFDVFDDEKRAIASFV